MKLTKSDVKMFEEELNLIRDSKSNKYYAIIGVEALASGAVLFSNSFIASILTLSIIPTAMYAINKTNVKNFEFDKNIISQKNASYGTMDRLGGEDYDYIFSNDAMLKKFNLTSKDLNDFVVKMKLNAVNYVDDKISKREYKKIKKELETALINKSKANNNVAEK